MKENIEWSEYSNSEIEIKLKELEFEHDNKKNEIAKMYDELNYLNSNYIKGLEILNKRTKKYY